MDQKDPSIINNGKFDISLHKDCVSDLLLGSDAPVESKSVKVSVGASIVRPKRWEGVWNHGIWYM